jgi:hypothetical protein
MKGCGRGPEGAGAWRCHAARSGLVRRVRGRPGPALDHSSQHGRAGATLIVDCVGGPKLVPRRATSLEAGPMSERTRFLGLDAHKATIAVAIAEVGLVRNHRPGERRVVSPRDAASLIKPDPA